MCFFASLSLQYGLMIIVIFLLEVTAGALAAVYKTEVRFLRATYFNSPH